MCNDMEPAGPEIPVLNEEEDQEKKIPEQHLNMWRDQEILILENQTV